MKEIGGYIELDKANGKEYHSEAIALNSGRHCLEYLIRCKHIKKIYLPYFLCASVRQLCEKCGCEYEFYEVDKNLRPIFPEQMREEAYLYVVNYYGQITNEEIQDWKKQHENLIIDHAQAFFQLPVSGVDTLYTCRKFFGVSDGGYLYTDKKIEQELEVDKSYERIHYILGRFEEDAGAFYEESAQNNKCFRSENLKQMSKLTHNLLRNIDYKSVCQKRTENFEYLHQYLEKLNRLNVTVPGGAFMYPLYVENGSTLKKKLIQEKIFVPTLWGDVFEVTSKESMANQFAENIVPLPCDQRYGREEMERIISVLRELIF